MAMIAIQTREGVMSMPCKMVGPFAIHASVHNTSLWTVTHVSTGYAVVDGLVLESQAERAAEALQPLADWNFHKPDAVKAWPEPVRAKIRGLVGRIKRDDDLRAWLVA